MPSGGNDKIAGCFLNGMAERIPIRAVIGMTASERTRLVGNRLELPGGKVVPKKSVAMPGS